MSLDHKLIICDCGDVEHQLIVSWDTITDSYYWEEMTVQVHLSKQPFWRRLVYAVRYIFGYQSKYGAFTEMVLNKKQALELRDACNSYLSKLEEYDDGNQRN